MYRIIDKALPVAKKVTFLPSNTCSSCRLRSVLCLWYDNSEAETDKQAYEPTVCFLAPRQNDSRDGMQTVSPVHMAVYSASRYRFYTNRTVGNPISSANNSGLSHFVTNENSYDTCLYNNQLAIEIYAWNFIWPSRQYGLHDFCSFQELSQPFGASVKDESTYAWSTMRRPGRNFAKLDRVRNYENHRALSTCTEIGQICLKEYACFCVLSNTTPRTFIGGKNTSSTRWK